VEAEEMTIHATCEILYHYQCPQCELWWSVADIAVPKVAHCPHCGCEDEVELMEGVD
jgi:uncharacterized paraquat-inducible protein A